MMRVLKLICLLAVIVAIAAAPAMAAKRIIVLNSNQTGANVCYSVVYWFAITSGKQTQTSGSAWTGASAAENTAIQNGDVKEEADTKCVPVGQDPTTIKNILVQQWTVRNSQINGIGPAQYQGVYFDSATGWSQ